jgi:type VI secretion system protein ImpG
MEIHSILSVEATRTAGEKKIEYLPFHRPQHPQDLTDLQRYWHATRNFKPTGNEDADKGSDVELVVVDLQGRPSPKDQWTLHVQTLCCNRDLVKHLSVRSKLRCTSGTIRTAFSTSPTPTRRPVTDDQWYWRLISHLSLNHLSLSGQSGAELLKEMLTLYLSEDERDAKEIRYKAIDAIGSISYQRDTARMMNPHGGLGVCRGIRILMEVDEERMEVIGTYLLCSLLDRFFALFATINSWTQLTVRSNGSGGREIYRGPRRVGYREML